MANIQRLEERVRLDDDMCKRINEILDGLESETDEYKYPCAIGKIEAVMQYSGRRETRPYIFSPERIKRTDDKRNGSMKVKVQ